MHPLRGELLNFVRGTSRFGAALNLRQNNFCIFQIDSAPSKVFHMHAFRRSFEKMQQHVMVVASTDADRYPRFQNIRMLGIGAAAFSFDK